ncbi:flavin reductase family protein [Amycolatopsis thermophila]|uniref:Flavin reductase (DIM6/NTAB) family NADH-FMN oxidoreductase RutF n=1 Tax=Amycolatopsis thermophila TaxID=206084 RepID=A0ABU0EU83_9PSEU|nr:flavin reductase family protein [Amycolatopsis thermophila]MDQ0378352.1 flavin reductase (DIM6/NTAB) family NADH-FMN oxidoreductase RutF [Amycolatopsis thermophila]
MTHEEIEPNILYFGTPVVLVSTVDGHGTANLAPISSAFWLGWRGILGIGASSQTVRNLRATGECVLNLPSVEQVGAVDRLARTTGTPSIRESKLRRGYRYEKDKFGVAGLTPVASVTVAAPRVAECPVAMEAVVEAIHPVAADSEDLCGNVLCFEVRVRKVHVHKEIRMAGTTDRIDPDRWRPLIMSFQEFYGLGGKLHRSELAQIPENLYRSPDIDRARLTPSR